MLKFAETAQVGDVIKAFDFKPFPEYAKADHPDSYLVGRVVKKGPMIVTLPDGRTSHMCDGYKVYVTDSVTGNDRYDFNRIGTEVIVPFEVDIMEYDERISVVEAV